MTYPSKSTITRHELIGLPVSVHSSLNPTQTGIRGKVVDETKNTLVLFNGAKKLQVQKYGSVYIFILPDNTTVKVSGEEILGRPVERVGKSRRRKWRARYRS
jgi:ribonuclease P protein subunit POP4